MEKFLKFQEQSIPNLLIPHFQNHHRQSQSFFELIKNKPLVSLAIYQALPLNFYLA